MYVNVVLEDKTPPVEYILPYIDRHQMQLVAPNFSLGARYHFNNIDTSEFDSIYLEMKSAVKETFVDLCNIYKQKYGSMTATALGKQLQQTFDRVQSLQVLDSQIKQIAADKYYNRV